MEVQLQHDSNSGFWIYFNTGLHDLYPWASHNISISFDRNSYRGFSVLSLGIVAEESEEMNDIVIARPRNSRAGITQDHDIVAPVHPSIEPRHSRYPSTSTSVVASVLLELYPDPPYFCLRPLMHCKRGISRLSLLYWETFPCSVAEHSWNITLRCSRGRTNSVIEPIFVPVNLRYDVRLLPLRLTDKVGSTLSELPFSIIEFIAHYVLNRLDSCWVSALLDLALVQKSWSGLVDLYWVRVGKGMNKIVNFPATTKILVASPQKVKCFTNFDTLVVHTEWASQKEVSDLFALLSSMRRVWIFDWLFYEGINALRPFRAVRELMILHYHDLSKAINMNDLLQTIHEWKHLKRLDVQLAKGVNQKYHEVSFNALKASFQLTHLQLGEGHVTAEQIIYLVSFSPTALTDLTLFDIPGLSNRAIHQILLLVSSTLQKVSMWSLNLVAQVEGEEHAFEAALPFMQNLIEAKIDADFLTNKALSRKVFSSDTTAISISSYPIHCVFGDEGRAVPSLSEALQVTGWNKITLGFLYGLPGDSNHVDVNAERECHNAKLIARDRDRLYLNIRSR